MAQKPKRARTERREGERAASRLSRDREKLFRLSPGGSPELPIEAPSASVVETHATGMPCPRCDGQHAVEEHAAVTGPHGARLREARLRCRRCGSQRSLFFRLPLLN
ncbi:MAG TPA: hypothetical protein VH062_30425 [Polyangiaceae bacterium]|jgi:hypothetical protein|nr:hypothetical protein [Polyangiaceae bacterium]